MRSVSFPSLRHVLDMLAVPRTTAPVVEIHNPRHGSASDGPVIRRLGPTNDHECRQLPCRWNSNCAAKQVLARHMPSGDHSAETHCPGCKQKILQRWVY